MADLLLIKTGALGDVLRTTSILPGLAAVRPDLRVVWLTAPGAVDLVRHHPRVAEVIAVDPRDRGALEDLGARLAARWPAGPARVISLDDELPLCALASRLAAPWERPGVLSGAYLDRPAPLGSGERRYTPDVGPWFDMGLLSVFGKAEADRRKIANRQSHAAIYADMLGIPIGEPELPLPGVHAEFGARFLTGPAGDLPRPLVGLNTGSGGRWESKKLPLERTVELALAIDRARGGQVGFCLLGGPEEAERNRRLAEALAAAQVACVDTGTDNSLLDFTAIVDGLDLLITSDSLALHIAVARRVPVLAFFAPTSAAEIELYGRGRKVVSTAPDYCSYAKDADTSTLTVERLLPPALELLDRERAGLGERSAGLP